MQEEESGKKRIPKERWARALMIQLTNVTEEYLCTSGSTRKAFGELHPSPFPLGTDRLLEILVTREIPHAGRHHLQAGTDLSSRSRFCFRAWRSITLVLVLVFFQE